MCNTISVPRSFLRIIQGVVRAAITSPFDRSAFFLVWFTDDIHFVRYHERRIKSQSVTDDVVFPLLFFYEILCWRQAALVEVFFSSAVGPILSGMVRCFLFFIYRDINRQITQARPWRHLWMTKSAVWRHRLHWIPTLSKDFPGQNKGIS